MHHSLPEENCSEKTSLRGEGRESVVFEWWGKVSDILTGLQWSRTIGNTKRVSGGHFEGHPFVSSCFL